MTDLRPSRRHRVAAASGAVVLAGLLFGSTMLRGVDLGDTPSFQTMGASPFITPRDAYPLYFATSAPLVWLTGDRALGMNLASVAAAALAIGVILLVALELSGAVLPSIAAALAFAGSYTFWSQAVTAEVYALHMLCLAAIWLAAHSWERHRTVQRLAFLFAACAIALTNHLTTALLLPALALFVLVTPGGTRQLLSRHALSAACLCAIAGASLYAWNMRTLLLSPTAPASLGQAAHAFWFDVTKADWRQTMVLELPSSMAAERLQQFVFDARQQFDWILALSALGAADLALHAPRRALLYGASYAASVAFAFTYNVGDTHVFLLPAHMVVALLVAPGLSRLSSLVSRAGRAGISTATCALVVAAIALRVHGEYPALDRSRDRRAVQALETMTASVRDPRDVLFGDADWQLQNALNYHATRTRTDLTASLMADVLPYAQTLIDDNLAIGRNVVLTERARALLESRHGSRYLPVPDAGAFRRDLGLEATSMAIGTRYVLCLVKPVEGTPVDVDATTRALVHLTGGTLPMMPSGDFVVVAGLVGSAPRLVRQDSRPFRSKVDLADLDILVRFDAWLPFDTIRRMGFGHVIANRQHALIVERGVSLVTLAPDGTPLTTIYAAGVYEPQRLFRLVAPT